ncbi:carboxypeptidase-like regulatory domain-containing protein [Pedobacter sp. UC225_65]|uniref:carboxypeptidase-like regulatory domain-containing protein n=1 Tax=Pedobacter sp. UC225_65 TaxID=3350173 RepID=UPI00366C4199
MIVLSKNYAIVVFIFLMLCGAQTETKAQNILGKNISLLIRQQKLSKVLAAIEQQGNFRFSYNSTILPLDSLVDLNVANLSIAETLDKLFKQRYEYREAYDFIIIRYAPLQLALITQESVGDQYIYTITGKVVDEQSRKPIANASVYEKNLLQSTLTDQDGAFTLKLKNISQTIAITISKLNYKDITSFFLPEITVFKNKRKNSNRYIDDAPSELGQTFLGRLLITSRQKIQTANTGGFIANAPAQISLGPGLSSHGSLSGQVDQQVFF